MEALFPFDPDGTVLRYPGLGSFTGVRQLLGCLCGGYGGKEHSEREYAH
jgi:hypothetical protein